MAPAKPSLDLLRSLTDEHVLRALMEQRRLTRAQLAARTGLSKPTVSDSVRRLCTVFVLIIGWLYLLPQLQGAGLALTTLTALPAWSGIASRRSARSRRLSASCRPRPRPVTTRSWPPRAARW